MLRMAHLEELLLGVNEVLALLHLQPHPLHLLDVHLPGHRLLTTRLLLGLGQRHWE